MRISQTVAHFGAGALALCLRSPPKPREFRTATLRRVLRPSRSEAPPTPCVKEQSGGGCCALAAFGGRDFIAPRRTLPYSRSHSSRVGKRGFQAEFFGITGIDAGDKGRDKVFQNFVAEFAANESRQRILPRLAAVVCLKGSEAIFQREIGRSARSGRSSACGDIGIFRRRP